MPIPWYNTHITQGFKWAPGGFTKAHSGVDLAEDNGTPLTAPVTCTILHAGPHNWGGQVDMAFNILGQDYVLTFLHMSDIYVQAGQLVQAGQVVGLSGGATWSSPYPTQSKFSTGPHLHLELTHGNLAPYNDYNPWRPTATNYPINGTSFFYALKHYGIQGDTTALSAISGTAYGTGVFSTADPYANDASVSGGTGLTSNPGSVANGVSGVPVVDSAVAAPASVGWGSATGAAHNLLVEFPGFTGIALGLDAAEYVQPFTPPDANQLPVVGPSITAGSTAGALGSWAIENSTGILFRVLLVGVGTVLLLGLLFALVRGPAVAGLETASQVAVLAA